MSNLTHQNKTIRTYESDIHATGGKGTAFGCPAQAVLEDPRVKVLLSSFCEAEIGVGNALKDIVVVLRRAENARGGVRDIPATR
jgi:hypothetical protein